MNEPDAKTPIRPEDTQQIGDEPVVSNLDTTEPFQVMPPLTDDEFAALVADIRCNGVLVPIVVDQHGRTIEGHNRRRAAAEAAVDCPMIVRPVADDEEARELALSLNLARRHLTTAQRQEFIITELRTTPEHSDRRIARRLGCSPTTVGHYRAEIKKHDRHRDRQAAIQKAERDREAAAQKAERERENAERRREEAVMSPVGMLLDAKRLHNGVWRRHHWKTGEFVLTAGGHRLTWAEAAANLHFAYFGSGYLADDFRSFFIEAGMDQQGAADLAAKVAADTEERYAPIFDEIREQQCPPGCTTCERRETA